MPVAAVQRTRAVHAPCAAALLRSAAPCHTVTSKLPARRELLARGAALLGAGTLALHVPPAHAAVQRLSARGDKQRAGLRGDCRAAAAPRLPLVVRAGKREPTVLGSHSFATKAAAAEFVSAKLRELPFGRVAPEDEAWLRPLLASHYQATRHALASRPDAYFVKMRPERGGVCFGVVTPEGGAEDFSIRKCTLLAPPPSYGSQLQRALRGEVADQTLAFRAAAFAAGAPPPRCAATGVALELAGTHVDHDFSTPGKTFVELLAAYGEVLQARELAARGAVARRAA